MSLNIVFMNLNTIKFKSWREGRITETVKKSEEHVKSLEDHISEHSSQLVSMEAEAQSRTNRGSALEKQVTDFTDELGPFKA